MAKGTLIVRARRGQIGGDRIDVIRCRAEGLSQFAPRPLRHS
jgi:hypothetical protein